MGPRVAEPKKWFFPNFIFKGWEWCIWTITTIIHHQIWSADSTADITVIQSSKWSTLRSTFGRVPVHFFNCSWWNYFNFYTYFWISLKNLTDLDVWPPFWPWLFLHKMQKKRRLKWRPNIMIGQIFQWNPKIYIKIEIISPRAIKKVDGHPFKSWPQCCQFWTLDDCNVSCWADGTSPIMDFDSWALGLSSPMKNKKKFFWLLWKKMPFFEILHVK